MRVVLSCLLVLVNLGATQSVRAQTEAGQVAEAPAPTATETAPATAQANTADTGKPEPARMSAAENAAVFALIVLAAGALCFTYLFVRHVRYGHKVGIESHWGGLGGGLGGWRISSALCFLIGSLVFAGALSALAIRFLDRDAPRQAVVANAPAADGIASDGAAVDAAQ